MPELPEVQTTVNGLNAKVLNRTFVDVWSDWYKFPKKELKGKRILKVWRRAKNVIFELSENYSLLVHQKMTGHLLTGKWKEDPYNRFIHLILFLDDGNKVKVSLVLRGREKAFGYMAKDKVELFLKVLNEIIPIKTERELKREPRGFTTIISKS